MRPVSDGLHERPSGCDAGEGAPGQLHQRCGIAVGAGVEEAVGINRQGLDRTLTHMGQHWIGVVRNLNRGGIGQPGAARVRQQTAGAISLRAAAYDSPTLVYFLTIDGAKFRKPVVPGDRLELKVRKIKKRGNIVRFACEAFVDGAMVAEAEIAAMLAPALAA